MLSACELEEMWEMKAENLEEATKKHKQLQALKAFLESRDQTKASSTALATMNVYWVNPWRQGDEESALGLQVRMSTLRELIQVEVDKLAEELQDMGVTV